MNESTPPPTAAAAIAQSNQRNAAIRGSTADSTYLREWKRFKKFVEEQILLKVLPLGDKYLTRESVDLYCLMVVATLTCTPGVARLIRPALHFFADSEEYLNDEFTVDSDNMANAFTTQETSYAKSQLDLKIDPHANLPINQLTTEEHQLALSTIYLKRITNAGNHWHVHGFWVIIRLFVVILFYR